MVDEKKTVLVVDDDEGMLDTLTAILRRDYRVLRASSGEAALTVLGNAGWCCDLVLLDVRLPGISGFEVLRIIHDVPNSPPVIMISAINEIETSVEAIKCGAAHYLTKDFDYQQLQDLVRMYVEGSPTDLLSAAKEVTRISDTVAARAASDPLARALAETVGSFCHDLTNSMSAIHLTLTECEEHAAPPPVHLRALARHAMDGLAELHSFVQTFYRGETDSRMNVTASSAASHLTNLLRPLSEATGADLAIRLEGFTAEQNLPALLFRVLLVPLVTNATEALASSPSASQATITVTIRCLPNDEGWSIRVVDTGPGWGENLSQIQDAIRNRSRFSTKGESRGHGLAHLARLVRRLGGVVLPSNGVPVGAVVEIRIPNPIEGAR